MFKDLRFTFEKFSNPDWGFIGTFEETYVPDEIFQPFYETVMAHADAILKYEGILNRAFRESTKATKWFWPQTLSHTMVLWDELDLARGCVFRNAVDDACIKIEDVPPGDGGGSCTADYINFRRDLTLNDPVYLAHESGHLIANLMAPYRYSQIPWNTVEMPAFFMQERAYEDLREHARNPAEIRTIDLHRVSEYVSTLTRIPFCLWIMNEEDRPGYSDSLRDIFAEWSIQDEGTIDRFTDWAKMDDMLRSRKARFMPTHCRPC